MFKINPPLFSRRGSLINSLSFADDFLSKRIAVQYNSAISFAEICKNHSNDCFAIMDSNILKGYEMNNIFEAVFTKALIDTNETQ